MDKVEEREDGLEKATEAMPALQRENEMLADELKSSQAEVSRLREAVVAGEKEIASLRQSLQEAQTRVLELEKALAGAVAAYRNLVVQSNPGLVGELVGGDTIEAVDESLRKAGSLVEKVRQEIEAENARTRVPAGSPQRLPPDFSGLSAREKIQYAIGGSFS